MSSVGSPKDIKTIANKAKKTKPKSKKGKKITSGVKLDGFEIIEPDFGNKSVSSVLVNTEEEDDEMVVSDVEESLIDKTLQGEVLSEELKSDLHSLTLKTLTPDESKKSPISVFESPPCHGGSKR